MDGPVYFSIYLIFPVFSSFFLRSGTVRSVKIRGQFDTEQDTPKMVKKKKSQYF